MLETQGLAFGYGARLVGADVHLEVRAGEVLCLLGPNGGGKTTLFKTLLGLLRPLAGRVLIDGEDISHWPRQRLARAVGYVPQAHVTYFPFTVRSVVLMGRAPQLGPFATPSQHDQVLAEEALSALGVLHLAGRTYTEISGGERQLVLIARALAQEPRLLVMDEPTASLDFGNQVRVLRQVRELAARGLGIVLSTHDPDHVFMCGDRAALLHDGRLVAMGEPLDVITPQNLERLYGVEVDILELEGSSRRVCVPALVSVLQ